MRHDIDLGPKYGLGGHMVVIRFSTGTTSWHGMACPSQVVTVDYAAERKSRR